MRVIGYVRVSTAKQDIGPEVQAAALEREAARHGWDLEMRREDAASAGSLRGRPVLAQALADLRAGRADVLAVSKLDRLSRSVADFSRLLVDADREGWHVVCLDIGVDTTSLTGRAMAQVTAVFAEMEPGRIAERTREGMARIRAETGKHMGRPVALQSAVDARVRELRAQGLTQQAICNVLAAEGVPTATGTGQWRPGTISKILARSAPVAEGDPTATGGRWWPATVRGVLERETVFAERQRDIQLEEVTPEMRAARANSEIVLEV